MFPLDVIKKGLTRGMVERNYRALLAEGCDPIVAAKGRLLMLQCIEQTEERQQKEREEYDRKHKQPGDIPELPETV